MEINELMIKEENELTENQAKFVLIHNNILNAGAMITNSVISLSKNLKVMRDEKLYLEANCESFEDYAEKICGLKRSQAYKYIQVLEKLGEDFVHSSGQIGITKLTMISSLTNEKKEELINTTDVENITVKELKEKIELLQRANNKFLENIEMKDEAICESKNKIEELNKKIAEFENKSIETIQPIDQTEELKMLEEELASLKSKLNNEKAKSKTAEEKYVAAQNDITMLQKQLEISQSTTLVEFKLKFNELQQNICEINKLIENVPEDKRENCKKALKKVVDTLC